MKSRKEEILALLQKNETGLTAGADRKSTPE